MAYGYKGVLQFAGFLAGRSFRLGQTTGVVAFAGGGQASATLISTPLAEVATVATAADSVKLPASVPGTVVVLVNSSANSMQVFGSGTDTINAVATGTGVAQAGGKTAAYYCTAAGKWFRDLSA